MQIIKIHTQTPHPTLLESEEAINKCTAVERPRPPFSPLSLSNMFARHTTDTFTIKHSQPHTLARDAYSCHPIRTLQKNSQTTRTDWHLTIPRHRLGCLAVAILGSSPVDREERLSEREEGRTHHHVCILRIVVCAAREQC
ncbi:unnamed protein product [Ectocarpus sp. 12 AP-2014]